MGAHANGANGVAEPSAASAAIPLAALRPHADGWGNPFTGLGLAERDKISNATFSLEITDYQTQRNLWRQDDLVARIVERPPEEMLREGYEVDTGDAELGDAVRAELEDLGVDAAMLRAMQYARAFGGGCVHMGIDDGRQMSEPLDAGAARRIEWVRAYHAHQMWVERWDRDTRSRTFGQPLVFAVSLIDGGQLLIHRSRLLLFQGVVTDAHHEREKRGWGDPIIQRVLGVISQGNQSWASTAHLLSDFSQAVYKIGGLRAAIAAKEVGAIQARAQLIEMSRSVCRGVLLDSESEDFRRDTVSLAGIGELLDRFMVRIAAAADMPVTLLFGQSPAGLSATGASDIRGFYDRIKSLQKSLLRPRLDRIVGLVIGFMRPGVASNWDIKFRSLWQPTEAERADTALKRAQEAAVLVDIGAATASEVARSLCVGEDAESAVTVSAGRLAGEQAAADRLAAVRSRTVSAVGAPAAAPVQVQVAATAPAGASAELSATAMNGAQVSSALEIVGQVARRELPRDAAIGMLQAFFQLSQARAEMVLGSVGLEFFSGGAAAPAPGVMP